HGGTLLGFIVGLLVGLGAALAVAVYVTKVPIPFVDRGVSRNANQDLIEAERNRGWNPNATLGGRAGNQPVAPVVVPPADPAGAIVVPPADGRDLPPAGTAPPTAGDPLGDLVQSRLGQPATPAAAPASADASGGSAYFVQAGAFRNPDDAQAQRARLAMLGIDSSVTEREQAGRTIYRVRVGPFVDRALADVTREQLTVNGVDAALVRVDR
ncbi:MAG: sporulation protein, partial [Comamonadaceae bacterium]|nr:sporulation protein [Comamonadaceae bacterium]